MKLENKLCPNSIPTFFIETFHRKLVFTLDGVEIVPHIGFLFKCMYVTKKKIMKINSKKYEEKKLVQRQIFEGYRKINIDLALHICSPFFSYNKTDEIMALEEETTRKETIVRSLKLIHR